MQRLWKTSLQKISKIYKRIETMTAAPHIWLALRFNNDQFMANLFPLQLPNLARLFWIQSQGAFSVYLHLSSWGFRRQMESPLLFRGGPGANLVSSQPRALGQRRDLWEVRVYCAFSLSRWSQCPAGKDQSSPLLNIQGFQSPAMSLFIWIKRGR